MTQREEFERVFLHSGLADRDKHLCKAFWNKGFLSGVEAAKAQPQWIPVSERLPENNSGLYLCSGHEGTKFVCHRRHYEWIRSPQMKRVVAITHWMPIPSLPEAVK